MFIFPQYTIRVVLFCRFFAQRPHFAGLLCQQFAAALMQQPPLRFAHRWHVVAFKIHVYHIRQPVVKEGVPGEMLTPIERIQEHVNQTVGSALDVSLTAVISLFSQATLSLILGSAPCQ